MLSPKNHLPLAVIGVLAAISIVISSLLFKVEPMASENVNSLEGELIDDSVFEGSDSEEDEVIPQSARAGEMLVMMGAAPGQAQDELIESMNTLIQEAKETKAAEKNTEEAAQEEQTTEAEVVSSPLPEGQSSFDKKIQSGKIDVAIGLTPKQVTYISAVPEAWPEVTEEEETEEDTEEEVQEEEADEEASAETEESDEESVVYAPIWTEEDEESGEEESSAPEESSEEITEETSAEESSEESSEEITEETSAEESSEESSAEESSEDTTSEEESSDPQTEESSQSSEESSSTETASQESSGSGYNWEYNPGTTIRNATTISSELHDGFSELDHLAALLQCEAGSNYDGALAVANVVINRLNAGFEPTIYDVIYSPYQFATTRIAGYLKNGTVSSVCYTAAQDALNGINNVGDYLYFNGTYWLDPLSLERPYVVIGGNCFY